MTHNKRINLWASIVDGIVADYRRLSNACDAARQAGTLDPHGPLHDAVWRMFAGMLERVDEDGWIAWFIYDNDCGANAMTAKGCGKGMATKIKTSRQLARLIVASEDHIRPNK